MLRRYFVAQLAPALLLLAVPGLRGQDLAQVSSPNGRITFQLAGGPAVITESVEPHLQYRVLYDGKPLIEESYLGFDVDQQVALGHKLAIFNETRSTADETYTLPVGKTKTVRDHYNRLLVEYLQNGSLGRRMNMEVRAYDDGVAFRYLVPATDRLLDFRILGEMTQFRFAKDAATYPLELEGNSYEGEYRKTTLNGIRDGARIAMPFLAEQPGLAWVAVTEAGIEDYASSALVRTGDRTMQIHLAPRVDGSGLSVHLPTPMVTPWRVVLIADHPEKMLESNIITSLNPPSAIADTSWIQAGKAAWDWWSDSEPLTTASIERYIDFAAASKLEYVLIGEGWAAEGRRGVVDLLHSAPEFELTKAAGYAREKQVGLWLWAPWRSIEAQMEPAFTEFEKLGVRGIVVDGIERDDQQIIDFYREVAKRAADHHLMIDFHGGFKPDGLRREYPNVVTREAAMGLEYSKWTGRVTPDHDVMLAFTRLLTGPLDYTPGGFNNVTPAAFEAREHRPMTLGTRAHQLALYVIFESPLQMVADAPEAYTATESDRRDFAFIQDVPATWDETRAIAGKAGDFIAIARRKGESWFIGAITNRDGREIDLPLGFLGAGQFGAELYTDAADAAVNPKHAELDRKVIDASTTLHLELAPGGGAALRIRPAR